MALLVDAPPDVGFMIVISPILSSSISILVTVSAALRKWLPKESVVTEKNVENWKFTSNYLKQFFFFKFHTNCHTPIIWRGCRGHNPVNHRSNYVAVCICKGQSCTAWIGTTRTPTWVSGQRHYWRARSKGMHLGWLLFWNWKFDLVNSSIFLWRLTISWTSIEKSYP